MLSFLLWTNESFSLWNCLSKNSTLFSTRRIGALGLFLTNQGSEASEDTWGTFRTLWSKKSVRFQKGIFEFIKVSWTFSTFWHRRERKTTKCAFEIDFLPCARPIQHAWTQRFNLSYAYCSLGLTNGFLNKNFQEIKLFICHCSFITLAQKTTMRLQIVRFLETFRRALSWIKTEVLFFTCSALNCYSFAHSLLAIQEFPACRIQGFLQFCSVQRAALFP